MILFYAFALIFRLALSFYGTYWGDMNSWLGWSNRLLNNNLHVFYDSWCDYLPSYLYLLLFLGKINVFLQTIFPFPAFVLFKLPSILADLGTAYLIYKVIDKFYSKNQAFIISLIYLFNPAIWYNSALWGQSDSFFTFFLFLTIHLTISNKIFLSAILFGFTILIKPFALFLLPFMLLYIYKNKGFRKIITFILFSLSTLFLLFVPFSNKNLILFIKERLLISLNQYPYTSLNAFNFWRIIVPFWTKDQNQFFFLNYQQWGMIIFLLIYFIVYKYYLNNVGKAKKEIIFILSGIVLYSAFLFLTRMHERHLFSVFAFLAPAMAAFPITGIIYGILSLLSVLNLWYAQIWLSTDFKELLSSLTVSGFSIINTAIFFIWLMIIFKVKKINLKLVNKLNFIKSNQYQPVKVRRANRIIFIIIILAFLIRIWNIWHPRHYIFDEVYHGFTAQEMAKGNVQAWEWWNNSPEGFAYEWTHPPLGKLFMTLGVYIFGNGADKQFAFRIPAVIFSLGVIYLTYLLAKQLFFNERIALFASLILSFEGLFFVMSRVGMIDIYFLFFLLLTIYLTLIKKKLFAGISLGLAIAAKWTGFYLIPVIITLLIFEMLSGKNKFEYFKREGVKSLFIFTFIPILSYLLVFIPFFTSGHDLSKFMELQKQMWWYHTHLEATHAYQSTALTWPFLIRPVWFWVDYQEKSIANIYNLGNPFVFWTGFVLVIYSFYFLFFEIKNGKYSLLKLLIFYFAFWLPWIFSPRIMFLHHYLPAIPFLSIIIAFMLEKLWQLKSATGKKIGQKAVLIYLFLTILLFIYFYPVYTGLPIPNQYLKFFFWLPSWR